MKYKLKDTDEMYVKVYPYNSVFVTPTYIDLQYIEKSIERHVDDIGSVECIQEKVYTYEENGIEYEAENLVKLCSDIAYDRDILNDPYRWEVKWIRNNEKYSAVLWELEDLLDYVSRYNCEIVEGELSKTQEALVNVARDLYYESK